MRMIMDDEPHPFRSEQYSYYTPCDACGVSFANHAGLSEKPFVDPFAVRERIPKCPYCNSTSGNHRPSCPQRPVKVPTIDEMAGLLAPEPGTSLSLLIISLGDSCVVKVERGEITAHHSLFKYLTEIGFWHSKTHLITSKPFAAVRDAIDSQDKPVPRIERSWLGGYVRYTVFFHDTSFPLPNNPYEALSQLVGHDLPIWDGGGKWELVSAVEVDVWRYTRGSE